MWVEVVVVAAALYGDKSCALQWPEKQVSPKFRKVFLSGFQEEEQYIQPWINRVQISNLQIS